MTYAEFLKTLKEVYRQYQYRFRSYRGPSKQTKIKGGIIEKMGVLAWDTEEIPRKIKFNHSIKRKYIASALAEIGLKVTRYTREYGKTIVHCEPISDSE